MVINKCEKFGEDCADGIELERGQQKGCHLHVATASLHKTEKVLQKGHKLPRFLNNSRGNRTWPKHYGHKHNMFVM